MEERLNWKKIVRHYPKQWVALANYKSYGPLEIEGQVIAHNRDKRKFHHQLRLKLPQHQEVAIRYTGAIIRNPEIPLLWQISSTDRKKG